MSIRSDLSEIVTSLDDLVERLSQIQQKLRERNRRDMVVALNRATNMIALGAQQADVVLYDSGWKDIERGG